MKENAASRASAMRCPGGGGDQRAPAPGERKSGRRPRKHAAAIDVRRDAFGDRSRRASSASVSPAWTRPRWRSGSASSSMRGSAPTTGMPIASIASAAKPA